MNITTIGIRITLTTLIVTYALGTSPAVHAKNVTVEKISYNEGYEIIQNTSDIIPSIKANNKIYKLKGDIIKLLNDNDITNQKAPYTNENKLTVYLVLKNSFSNNAPLVYSFYAYKLDTGKLEKIFQQEYNEKTGKDLRPVAMDKNKIIMRAKNFKTLADEIYIMSSVCETSWRDIHNISDTPALYLDISNKKTIHLGLKEYTVPKSIINKELRALKDPICSR
ncbi:MAG: hypothetical protein NTX63_05365 [Candidatus Peregrinibacteria bacterium]|nr:hypothetical protein [Candidatus Peregrinibacteria bacterium]